MRRWTHKISVVIAVICITLGMIGIFHYKWNEIYQKNKHECELPPFLHLKHFLTR